MQLAASQGSTKDDNGSPKECPHNVLVKIYNAFTALCILFTAGNNTA